MSDYCNVRILLLDAMGTASSMFVAMKPGLLS